MKNVPKLFLLLVIAGTMALTIPWYPPAHGRAEEDRTLSPYFFVQEACLIKRASFCLSQVSFLLDKEA
jgi:hypothetical protein